MQITISQLKKAFNDNMAVNIDSLHVNDGEIIGLVGNNGAGKTTMFRLMLDLLKADNGYVDLTFCTNANEQTQGTGDAADTITVDPAKMEDWNLLQCSIMTLIHNMIWNQIKIYQVKLSMDYQRAKAVFWGKCFSQIRMGFKTLQIII